MEDKTIEKPEKQIYLYIISEIVNLAELTLVANLYIKRNEEHTEIIHGSNEYIFKFQNEEQPIITVKDWIEKLKEKEVEDLYLDYDVPSRIKVQDSAVINATPAGILVKYKNGEITGWFKKWGKDPKTNRTRVIYYEEPMNSGIYDKRFVDRIDLNYKYFKNAIKKIREFAREIDCDKYWGTRFDNVLELEDIEKAKKLPASERLYGIISDKNLCIYAMAMAAYPFGGMGSWSDEPQGIATKKNLTNKYDTLSLELYAELMSMLSYVTTAV